jgi:hypothetical protein
MPTSPSYQDQIETLFQEAEELFSRIKDGEDCNALTPLAIALDARFDEAGDTLLQGLYNEVKAKIDAEPKKAIKDDIAFYYYERWFRQGVVFGPRYMQTDRMARVCYRNYTDGEDELHHGLLSKRDCLLDTMHDVHDWLCHYATTISEWWSGPAPDFGQYYGPKMNAETIVKYLPGIPTRTYSTLMRVLRPGRPRPQYEWEAIARIIYDCAYFKDTRKHTTREYKNGRIVKKATRIKAWSFNEWCNEVTRLVGIPPFTQRAGNKQVDAEIKRLKRTSGKDGGLKFLPTKTR